MVSLKYIVLFNLHVFRFCIAVNDVGIRSTCFRIVIIICYMSLLCKDNVIFSERNKLCNFSQLTFPTSHFVYFKAYNLCRILCFTSPTEKICYI